MAISGDNRAPSPFLSITPMAWNTIAQFKLLLTRLLPFSVAHPITGLADRYLIPGHTGSWDRTGLGTFLDDLRGGGGGGAGYGRNFAIVLFAILVNHVRRVLFPSTAVGGYAGPIGMLKLAAGSPELFLLEEFEMGFPGRNWGYRSGALAKIAWDWVGIFAGETLNGGVAKLDARNRWKDAARGDGVRPAAGRPVKATQEDWGREADGERIERKISTVAAVVVVVWYLGAAEYIHARIAHVVSVGIAYWKMASGGDVYRDALWRAFVPGGSLPRGAGFVEVIEAFVTGFWKNGDKFRIIFFHFELWVYLVYAIYPLLRLALLRAVGFGQTRGRGGVRWLGPSPGLAGVLAGWVWLTGYVAKYSNKYYIGLQVSEALLVGWWAFAAVVGVVVVVVRDRIRKMRSRVEGARR
ncbi:uncharacterized protein CTRU02_204428 [Colletotrichum truncatum]|uniref:Uncharacterized protein n=1 Tax=Colletotrichum truncatum TaxID=5467 RepID=A0ACC3ZC11_COLTU|nr:uncharacterized protein CTRU02_14410 [Colletotrichum truncatum]KAF6782223.1 hypothetical protein CTRU02_14410 [Colletotrichum truncatum]